MRQVPAGMGMSEPFKGMSICCPHSSPSEVPPRREGAAFTRTWLLYSWYASVVPMMKELGMLKPATMAFVISLLDTPGGANTCQLHGEREPGESRSW